MAGLVVPQVPFGLTMEEYAEIIAKALKEIDWAFNGNISDQNISRIANFLASKTELKHISGLVGLSGYDAANPLAVRLWAGNADKSLGPFRVLQNGYMYSTRGFIGGWDIDEDRLSGTGTIEGGTIIGSEIMTALAGVYPRASMSSIDNLFTAEQSADVFIKMVSDYFGAVALLIDNDTVSGVIQPFGSDLFISTFVGFGNIQISSGEDLKLYAAPGKLVRVESWAKFYNEDDNKTLQQELDAIQSQLNQKQDEFIGGDIVVIDDEAYLTATGIADGTYTKLTINDQGRATAGTTLSSSDIPTLAQSKITNLTTDLAGKANTTQEAWNTPTFQNSWVNFGSGFSAAAYKKDNMGTVHLKGVVKSGTVGTDIFTLPAGYRPAESRMFRTITNTGVGNDVIGRADIYGNGEVKHIQGGNTYFVLDGISFPAEQ